MAWCVCQHRSNLVSLCTEICLTRRLSSALWASTLLEASFAILHIFDASNAKAAVWVHRTSCTNDCASRYNGQSPLLYFGKRLIRLAFGTLAVDTAQITMNAVYFWPLVACRRLPHNLFCPLIGHIDSLAWTWA